MERYRIICVKLYNQNCLGKKQKTVSGNEKNMILLQKIAQRNHVFSKFESPIDSKMIAAHFGQLFIPIKRDKWLTGCFPILYGAKCSAEFLKRTRQSIFCLKECF